MKSRFSLSKAWVLPLILLLTLLALLFFQQGTDQPPAAAQSSAGQPRAVDTAAIKAFGTWLADGNRTAFTTEGIELAKARRAALKELIQIDPEAALGFAVPYALRRGLPREISSLLETPVSTTAELSVEIACGGPGGSGFRRQWATLGNERIRVFTYGRRAEVMTKTKLSVHGIAIDDVMAMRDDPLREWSPEEVADNGRTGRIAQLGNRLFEIESDEAIEAARRKLRETEELIGPMALPAYRELALGGRLRC